MKRNKGGVKLKLLLIDPSAFPECTTPDQSAYVAIRMANMVPGDYNKILLNYLCFIFLHPDRDRQESNLVPQRNLWCSANKPQSQMKRCRKSLQTTIPMISNQLSIDIKSLSS